MDNIDFRDQLRQLEPEAIGGEMEGAGLYDAASLHKVDWIVVKSICDWADGQKHKNKRVNQKKAAESATAFVFHTIEQGGLGSRETETVPLEEKTEKRNQRTEETRIDLTPSTSTPSPAEESKESYLDELELFRRRLGEQSDWLYEVDIVSLDSFSFNQITEELRAMVRRLHKMGRTNELLAQYGIQRIEEIVTNAHKEMVVTRTMFGSDEESDSATRVRNRYDALIRCRLLLESALEYLDHLMRAFGV